jgi:hypothetical protein
MLSLNNTTYDERKDWYCRLLLRYKVNHLKGKTLSISTCLGILSLNPFVIVKLVPVKSLSVGGLPLKPEQIILFYNA